MISSEIFLCRQIEVGEKVKCKKTKFDSLDFLDISPEDLSNDDLIRRKKSSGLHGVEKLNKNLPHFGKLKISTEKPSSHMSFYTGNTCLKNAIWAKESKKFPTGRKIHTTEKFLHFVNCFIYLKIFNGGYKNRLHDGRNVIEDPAK